MPSAVCYEELIGKINFAHYRQFVKADKTNRVVTVLVTLPGGTELAKAPPKVDSRDEKKSCYLVCQE